LIREHRPWWYRLLFAGIETFYEEHFRTMADATTVISRALGERATGLGVRRDSIFWVPNGCPIEAVEAVPSRTHRSRFGIPASAFVVADSAMDVTLGIEQTLRATASMAAECPDVLFLMTGGKEREIGRMATRLGVSDRVRHLGVLPYTDLAAALSCADVFLMVYPDCVANRGRWPGRMGTYLALGRPVVSNPVGEVRLLFESEKCGVLAENSPEAMARAVLALRNAPATAAELGARARRVAESMSWARMTDRVEQAYAFAREGLKDRLVAGTALAARDPL
jgi:glycosyltransferase involved in cell wall biosynthesis